jgi:hypothetical protein
VQLLAGILFEYPFSSGFQLKRSEGARIRELLHRKRSYLVFVSAGLFGSTGGNGSSFAEAIERSLS